MIYTEIINIFTFLQNEITISLVGEIFALLMIIWMVRTFLKCHFDPKSPIDLNDLVVDKTGKIGNSKMRLNLAFVVCTWVLVYYSLKGQLSEWLFGAYLGAFVFDRMQSRGSSKDQQDTTNNNQT